MGSKGKFEDFIEYLRKLLEKEREERVKIDVEALREFWNKHKKIVEKEGVFAILTPLEELATKLSDESKLELLLWTEKVGEENLSSSLFYLAGFVARLLLVDEKEKRVKMGLLGEMALAVEYAIDVVRNLKEQNELGEREYKKFLEILRALKKQRDRNQKFISELVVSESSNPLKKKSSEKDRSQGIDQHIIYEFYVVKTSKPQSDSVYKKFLVTSSNDEIHSQLSHEDEVDNWGEMNRVSSRVYLFTTN